jgi:hypothetical protein
MPGSACAISRNYRKLPVRLDHLNVQRWRDKKLRIAGPLGPEIVSRNSPKFPIRGDRLNDVDAFLPQNEHVLFAWLRFESGQWGTELVL